MSIELTLEEYRKEVNILRRLALSEHAHLLEEQINNPSKTTQLERDIWKTLAVNTTYVRAL